MKQIEVHFYSYRPRLHVSLFWTTDMVPNIGDEIRIGGKYISQLDKKYFPKWMKGEPMVFRVKERLWNLDRCGWRNYDVELKLDWSESEMVSVKRYLSTPKKIS